MVKKNTSGIALYKEDLKQSIEELTDLQRKMLSLTLSDLDPEQLKLDKIYPVSVDSFPEFRSQNAEEAYETLIESAQSLFDKFVMIRGGFYSPTQLCGGGTTKSNSIDGSPSSDTRIKHTPSV